MRRTLAIIALGGLVALGAGCDLTAPTHAVHFATDGTATSTCPVNGTTFAYGSCVVPAGVTDFPASMLSAAPGHESTGSPVQIVDPGCGLQVVPAGYTPGGPVTCQQLPG